MAQLKRYKTIQQALQYVADHPEPTVDAPVDMPAWELVCRVLFDVASNPDAKVRGSMVRATRAQRIISDQLVGKRRAGTHPAVATRDLLQFKDLTAGAIETGELS